VKRIENHVFLLLALLAIGLSVACYLLLEQSAPAANDEQYLSAVQQRVKEEMSISADELHRVADLVRRKPDPSFSDLSLPEQTQYPYYVFRNQKLLFWSDHRFIPSFSQVKDVKNPHLIDFEQGRYVVSHERVWRLKDTIDVFSLVNIYRYYRSSNTYLQSGYNPDLFVLDPEAVSNQRTSAFQSIYDNSSAFLFSVTPPKVVPYRNQSMPVNTITLAALGVIFLGLYLLQLLGWMREGRHYEWSFICLATYLVVLRGLMLYYGVPFLFIESDLFNPKYYASSILVPSLGDLLLNVLVVVVLVFYWVKYYYRSTTYNILLQLPFALQLMLSVGCVIASYFVFDYCYLELNNIYEKSQFTLDITLNIHFSLLKIVCLLVFVAISFGYFLAIQLLSSLFLRYNRVNHRLRGVILILVGTGVTVGLYILNSQVLNPVLIINGLYFLLIYLARFPRTLYRFEYKTSIYLFLGAFFCAVTTAYVVYSQEIRKQLAHEREFGAQLLAENDEFGEFLMNKAQASIAQDPQITQALQIDTLRLVRERIQQRVKSQHLDRYFDKYDIEIFSYRADMRPLDISTSAIPLSRLQESYKQKRYQTQYPNVYFVNEVGNQFIKQYVCFVTIQAPAVAGQIGPTAPLGYVVLDLRLRSGWPKNVYPALLVDAQFPQNPDAQGYSYAVYQRAEKPGRTRFHLKYNDGDFNYEKRLSSAILDSTTLFNRGLTLGGYMHVAQRGQDGRVVVVSATEYPFRNIFSNFSFLYLVLLLSVLIVIIGYGINYGFSRFSINYSTRIQILLNGAFFLPLMLVIVIIMSVISSNYITNQENAYINNTRNIASNFLTYLDEYLIAKKRSRASMEEELAKIAHDTHIDINLFDAQGQLFTSTQPLMYESGYLSKRINPEAYIHIIEEKENQRLVNESLGTKQFKTAYAGIKSYDGKLLGILSIPYFYARPEYDRQIIEVISSALSVFSALFIFFLILSYFASHALIKPLKMLTQKIKKTNLERQNDPLPWHSDDEIGLLIREYNRMLVNLEESKQALAQNEKQSAWREMAKQVAHEIKNPLTPMKLTLQHLQRTFPKASGATDTAAHRVIHRTFDSLLDQIDNLSDIATSFSDFAKMPLPKNEVFEVTSMLNRSADLYDDKHRVILRRDIIPGPVMAVGDRQLIGRILTNLMINGMQSVPSDRKAELDIRLYTKEDEVHIEVQDNGAGIPESIQSKVFLPNFSTKRDGSGLGLAIAKRGIEHAGGSIWFETTEDIGTCFFISLPLVNKTGAIGTDPADLLLKPSGTSWQSKVAN
jgi:nitrogen fixation/metabolism regulation signal transduction histidine kinase